MKMKRTLAILAAMMMSTAFITGCSDETNDDSSAPESSDTSDGNETEGKWERYDETVELTFLIDNDQAMEGYEAVFEAIEQDLNIKTVVDTRPGGTDGDNIVKTRLATGDMADLCFYNAGSLFQALNPSEYFVDLSDEEFIDRLDDTFRSTVTVDGVAYGIPSSATQVGAWMYNKDVYAELGLEIPSTWDELLENCQVIADAGITPVIGSYKDNWTSQLIVLADYYNILQEEPNFSEDFTNNEAKFATTPAALRSWEKLYEIYDKGYINSDLNSTTYDMGLEMLATGEGAHYPMLSFALPELEANFPDAIDSIGYFGQPGDDADNHGVTVWMPAGIYLNNECENIEAAKLWMEYYISDDGVAAMGSAAKPTGPYALKGVDMGDDVYAAVTDLVPTFDAGRTEPALEFLSPLKGSDLPQITQECGSGITTGAEAAQKYDNDVEKQAKQLGLEGW